MFTLIAKFIDFLRREKWESTHVGCFRSLGTVGQKRMGKPLQSFHVWLPAKKDDGSTGYCLTEILK